MHEIIKKLIKLFAVLQISVTFAPDKRTNTAPGGFSALNFLYYVTFFYFFLHWHFCRDLQFCKRCKFYFF